MSHPVITTDGIVLEKRGVGEASTVAAIFTREHGLLHARAQGSRLGKSKLRYSLEPLTEARFSLVRGKYGWKLINSYQPSAVICRGEYDVRAARAAAGKVARLLMRLIHGEEASPLLYDDVAGGLRLLSAARSREEADAIESVLVLRIVHRLGYLPATPELAPFIGDMSMSMELAARAAHSRAALIRSINHSLEATGL